MHGSESENTPQGEGKLQQREIRPATVVKMFPGALREATGAEGNISKSVYRLETSLKNLKYGQKFDKLTC